MSDNKTYSAAPFISYDGKDENGVRAEVKVGIGYGLVDEIAPSAKGVAANVLFVVSNSKYKSSGWAPTDSNVMAKVKEAESRGEPIHFRIETKRKDGIDRSTPMSVLNPPRDMTAAKENLLKSLVAVRFDDESDWTISPHALTRIDEDPRSSGSAVSAYDMSAEDLAASKPQASSNDNNGSSFNSFEPAPWTTYRNTGEINPGSIAVSVPLTIYSFVEEFCRENNVEIADKQKVAVARGLISTANRLQLSIYDGELESPDLAAGSHTRARALVFSGIKDFYPLTAEKVASPDSLKVWLGEIHDKSLAMWKWSISEIEKIA